MGVTDFVDSKACDKPVHEVHTPFLSPFFSENVYQPCYDHENTSIICICIWHSTAGTLTTDCAGDQRDDGWRCRLQL